MSYLSYVTILQVTSIFVPVPFLSCRITSLLLLPLPLLFLLLFMGVGFRETGAQSGGHGGNEGEEGQGVPQTTSKPHAAATRCALSLLFSSGDSDAFDFLHLSLEEEDLTSNSIFWIEQDRIGGDWRGEQRIRQNLTL